MKKITLICAIPIVVAALVFSCKKDKTSSDDEMQSLRLEYDTLLINVDSAWYKMITDDDEKIFFMKRLLQEVSYTNEYDSVAYAGLMEKVEELKNSRYTRESMKDSDLIDSYDRLTSMVIGDVIRFALGHPKFDNYPLMQELITDIRNMDGNVLIFRVGYDVAANEYNNFLEEHASEMDTIMFAIVEAAS